MINHLTRSLLALMLAIGLALPVVGGEGGENGGGTGIWILPRASFLSAQTVAPRDTRSISTQGNLVVQVSADVGVCTATSIDGLTGLPVALPVNGNQITIPGALLQAIGNTPTKTANVVIADAFQVGYLLRISVGANGCATVMVF